MLVLELHDDIHLVCAVGLALVRRDRHGTSDVLLAADDGYSWCDWGIYYLEVIGLVTLSDNYTPPPLG